MTYGDVIITFSKDIAKQ